MLRFSLKGRRLLVRLVPLALLLVVCGFSIRSIPDDGIQRFHVVLLHTNDIHGQSQPRAATWLNAENPPGIGGLPRLAAYVKKTRAEVKAAGSGFLLVDGGDWFQGTPEGSLDDGVPFVKAMMELGYDGVAVGNHELDHGVAKLARMIETCGVPALAANVYGEAGGEQVDWCDAYRIVQVGEMRVGIVGLLTPTTPSITHKDASELYFEPPAQTLGGLREMLADKVDWILPITHLGVRDDRRLAKALPELDVIVGGHSHSYLKDGVRQGETLIVQTGSKASAVGRVDLWFDPATWELVETKNRLIDLLEEPQAVHRNGRVDSQCAVLVERGDKVMNEVVGQLAQPLIRDFKRTHSTPGGNFLTDRMREFAGAQVAFQNRGGIRCNLQAGPVTRRNLFELLPFGNRLVLLELSGEDLLDCLRASVEGTAHTGLEVSGVTVLWDESAGAYRFLGAEIDGKPVDPVAKYRVATNNFLAGGGDGYDVLKGKKVLRDDPTILRDILARYFASAGSVKFPMEDRYRRSE